MNGEFVINSTNLLTFSNEHPIRSGSVHVKDGIISKVENQESLNQTKSLRIYDAGDRPVLPGFIDAHAHVEVAARVRYTHVDVRAPKCGTVSEVLDGLRDGIGRMQFDGWLLGQGNLFMDRKLREERLPTREELDSVSTEVAIALRAGGHITVLNTKALQLMGLADGYQPPESSITGKAIVERDSYGRPTGVIKEMDNLLPDPQLSDKDVRTALQDGITNMFTKYGVTTIGEISESPKGLKTMSQLAQSGDLPSRILTYLWAPGTVGWDQVDGIGSWARNNGISEVKNRFGIQGLKVFADGGYSASNAAVKSPYLDTCHCKGDLALSKEELRKVIGLTQDAGLQLAVHANGDRAQEVVSETIAEVLGSQKHQIRIEHAGNFLPEYEVTVNAWKKAGILPSPQPVFIYAFGDYFPDRLGEYGSRGRFPYRRLIDEGWKLPASSDVWVGSEENVTNPLFGISCMVTRKGFRGKPIDPEQKVSIEEGLEMYTINGAKVFGKEDEVGSLDAGKLADMIVLSKDPRKVSDDRLMDAEVDYVFREGNMIYKRPEAKPLEETVKV